MMFDNDHDEDEGAVDNDRDSGGVSDVFHRNRYLVSVSQAWNPLAC